MFMANTAKPLPVAGTRRWILAASSILLAVLTLYAVFVFPFWFPPAAPSRSTAYAAGASNRAAEIALGLISMLATLMHLRFRTSRAAPQRDASLARSWLWWGLGVMSALLLALGAAMVRAGIFYGEAEYFLTQLDKGLKQHLVLYGTVQFAYGPLLYWWPMGWIRALAPLGVSTMPAYVGALITTQAAGGALLFYTVKALPMRRRMQQFAFAAVLIGALSPTMGLNYSVLRFAAPLAFAVLLSRQPTPGRAAAVCALGTMACLAVSAEVGIAGIGGALGCALCRALDRSLLTADPPQRSNRLRWLLLLPASLAGAALFLALSGRAYLRMLLDAGTGGYDLLLTPETRLLLLMMALVGLAPVAVARALRSPADRSAPLLGALYGASLGMMPVAIGRCDAVHVYFFSLGAILLSLVAIDDVVLRTPARAWMGCIVLWVVMFQVANYRLYRLSLIALTRQAISPQPYTFDTGALERQLQGRRVFLVDDVPWTANEELLDRGLLMPSFYCGLSSIWRRPAEERKIAEMRAGDFALVPVDGMAEPVDFEDGPIARWRRLGLVYREINTPYEPGLLIDQEIANNWRRVATINNYVLVRKVH